jgi:hypothetical protein
VSDVGLDGVGREKEALGDAAVGKTFGH